MLRGLLGYLVGLLVGCWNKMLYILLFNVIVRHSSIYLCLVENGMWVALWRDCLCIFGVALLTRGMREKCFVRSVCRLRPFPTVNKRKEEGEHNSSLWIIESLNANKQCFMEREKELSSPRLYSLTSTMI